MVAALTRIVLVCVANTAECVNAVRRDVRSTPKLVDFARVMGVADAAQWQTAPKAIREAAFAKATAAVRGAKWKDVQNLTRAVGSA